MIIENSKIDSYISVDEEKENILDVLRVKDSDFSTDFSIVADRIEFENVNCPKMHLYNIENKADFVTVKSNAIFWLANNRETLGDFLFKDSKISHIGFLSKGEEYGKLYSYKALILGNMELKNCKGIEKVLLAKGSEGQEEQALL